MPRIQPVNKDTADTKTAQLLEGVNKKMGIVPNLVATMAQSNAVANAYLGFSSSLAGGALSAKEREQIALVVSENNSCNYCLAAHSMLGKGAGLDEEAILNARRGNSSDPRTDAILKFASKLVADRGRVADSDIEGLRSADLTEGEIAEVIANVALNIFTNYFNHVAETDVDFPAAKPLASN